MRLGQKAAQGRLRELGFAAISAKLGAGGSRTGARAWSGATMWQLRADVERELAAGGDVGLVPAGGNEASKGERESQRRKNELFMVSSKGGRPEPASSRSRPYRASAARGNPRGLPQSIIAALRILTIVA